MVVEEITISSFFKFSEVIFVVSIISSCVVDVEQFANNNKIAKILEETGISLVSDLLDSDMDSLLKLKDIDEQALDLIYESVQNYVERKIEPDEEEDEVDLSSLGIDLELENKTGGDLESELEISISEEE